MKKIKIGNHIQFLELGANLNIDKTKKYKVINLNSYKRKGEIINLITINDNLNQEFKFKLDENIIISTEDKLSILKTTNVYEKEYSITKLLHICLMHRKEVEQEIHKYLKELYNLAESSKSNEFKNLVENINSKDYNEDKALQALENLETLIENKAYQQGILIGNYKYEIEENNNSKQEVDNTDYEKEIMDSFTNGEYDRFGY